MRKKSLLATFALSAAMVVGACGGGASIVGSYDPGAAGETGGTLLVGDYQDVDSLNPFYYVTVMSANVMATTFDGLVTVTNEAKYVPWMATEIPSIANGGVKVPGDGGDAMTVTWKLREGLKWSDGVAITCADAKYTHSWILDPKNPVNTTGTKEISEVECVDDTTIVLHYSELYSALYGGVSIAPKHYFEQFTIGDGSATDMTLGAGFRPEDLKNVPTSGPFKFESRTEGVETVMVRNPNWKHPYTGKAANLDSIKYVVCGDPDTCIAKYRNGELDIVTDLDQGSKPVTDDLGTSQRVQSVFTYEFFRPNHSATDCSITPAILALRNGGCPASDPAIRKAVAQATDKATMLERILGGAGSVANSSVTPLAWFYKDPGAHKFDLEAAKKTLADAGWADTNGNNIVDKDGVEAVLEFCTTLKPVRKAVIAYAASDLAKVGIKAVYNGVSGAILFAPWTESAETDACNLSRGTFDVALHAYSSGIEAVSLYGVYHSTKFAPDGQNDAKVNDPEIDAALELIKGNVDLEKIKAAAFTVQQIGSDKTVEIPLFYWLGIELVSAKVGGFVQNPTQAGPLWNAGELSLSK